MQQADNVDIGAGDRATPFSVVAGVAHQIQPCISDWALPDAQRILCIRGVMQDALGIMARSFVRYESLCVTHIIA
jgi:hypothetical protein